MILYRVTSPDETSVTYHATLAIAHAAARAHKGRIGTTYVDQLRVAVDRDGVLSLLNGAPHAFVIKTWTLTDRGGLRPFTD